MAKSAETAMVPAGDRRYAALLEKISDWCVGANAENLKRYRKIGEFFTEFVQGIADGKRYGDATVEKLATDLQARGVLDEVKDPTRFLYWAKNVFDYFPDEDRIEKLAKAGFTFSHAKVLFTLKPELRQQVEAEMMKKGRVIPTRALQDLVVEKTNKRILEASTAAAAKAREETVSVDDDDDDEEGSDEEGEEGDDEAADESGEAQESEQDAPPEEPAAVRASTRPAGVPATGAPAQERTITDPLKRLKAFKGALMKTNSDIPDTFIVVRESEQIGYDSERARANYLRELGEIKAALHAAVEALPELQRTIDQALSAATLPPTE